MTQLKPRVVENALASKGFRVVEGDLHRFVFYFEDKKTEIRTKVSHNSRDLGEELIHLMARQTKLSKGDFVELVSCTLSGEGYVTKLRAAGVRLEPAAPS
jgi:predicted RNA binding protein YcfA (HicA-like mRNA interferase family)